MFTLPVRSPTSISRSVPSFVARLRDHGESPAVVGRRVVSYAELADRVDEVARRLASTHRRVVAVRVRNDVPSLVGYLGALASGHAVMLCAADADAAAAGVLAATYRPDATVQAVGDDVVVEVSPTDGGHELHPDLALLLSTSGTTGSPKLVRLSFDNLDANAAQIAEYLDIRTTDRAALTLPMHYCYGLSIVHSNLLAGAALLVDDRSVVDRCFWDEFRRSGGTSVSGVPYTFELLDRVGFAELELPTLRYVTQAGGRLAPDIVERYARLGHQRGWELFVMYGQTEATARMAYLPPALAATHPTSIGVPVPGGELAIDDGELVYRGPNVMLGYATSAADLALGRTVDELRTGDLAVRTPDGLHQIVGRASRFIKPFGLRIDLDLVEARLRAAGISAACTGDDHRLVVAIADGTAVAAALRAVTAAARLPLTAVDIVVVDELPRLPTGKVDYRAIRAAAPRARDHSHQADRPRVDTDEGLTSIAELFRRVLGVSHVDPGDTFVGLGGDSLSYVEMSIALEERVGQLPLEWPSLTITEIAARARVGGRRRRWRTVEMNVLLRAIAIVVIVGSHTAFMNVRGGAHVLLAVAGFNTARFHLSRAASSAREALTGLASGAARVALPAAAWIAAWVLVGERYSVANVLFVNSIVGPTRWGERWQYWFIEVLLHLLLGVGVLLAIPRARRLVATRGFEVATGLTVVGLALRYDAFGIANTERLIHRADSVLWFFTLGWAAYRATTTRQRVVLTALFAIGIPHYFESGRRESYVAIGVLALIWIARSPVPTAALPVVRVLAASSLYVYLTHWQLYPTVADATNPLVALLASLAAGAVVWWCVEAVASAVQRVRASRVQA